jgi:hypothetical protein
MGQCPDCGADRLVPLTFGSAAKQHALTPRIGALTVVEPVARISGSSSTSASRPAVLISTNTRAHRFVTKCLPENRSASRTPRRLWVQGLQALLSNGVPEPAAHALIIGRAMADSL